MTPDVVRTAAQAAVPGADPLLVLEPLLPILDDIGVGVGDAEIEVTRIGAGQSNATFALRRGDEVVVLRRPPRGPIQKGTHNVVREARILRALAGLVPVPRILAVVDDPGVIGAPFYVMEHLEGWVLTDELPAGFEGPDQQARIAEVLVDGLAALHAVDFGAAGLADFGRPEGYLERQIQTFTRLAERYTSAAGRPVAELAGWLRANLPAHSEATIVHGDYRLGNVLLEREPPARLRAVLDWEMATLGDPLADVGLLMLAWTEPGDPDRGPMELQPVTRTPGFPTRRELASRYADGTGRDLSALAFYEVLAAFKGVVIFTGNLDRALAGSAPNPQVVAMAAGLDALIEQTLAKCSAATTKGTTR